MQTPVKKVLIIDDDNRNIFALTAVLRSRGYHCLSTGNVSDAVELLKNNNGIGIILMDMMMPDMDGYEAIPRIKNSEAGYKIPIIAVTAQAMVGDKERCLAAGADGYVAKPVDVDALMALLHQYVG
ncbi:MAG: response regulator [Chitinophagaceae bacterium]|nr:MAG: response regulator [Chitinophagaceae bacterium]